MCNHFDESIINSEGLKSRSDDIITMLYHNNKKTNRETETSSKNYNSTNSSYRGSYKTF